jgi:hypothetical protein
MSAPQDPLAEQAAYRELAELETAQEIEKQDSLARQQGEFDAARDTLSASDLQTWLDGAAQIEAVVAKRIDDVVIGLRMTANLLDLIANANRDKADALDAQAARLDSLSATVRTQVASVRLCDSIRAHGADGRQLADSE